MKKLLSIVLALLMLTSVISTLAPLASAAETQASGGRLYAYQSTVQVDSYGGTCEPGLMVQNYLSNDVRYGAAWDYENIYLVFASVDYKHIEAVYVNLGGTSSSITDNPAFGEDGKISVNSTCGTKAAAAFNYIEIAIPLSEVTIEMDGADVITDLGFMVISESGSAEVEQDLVLSGRSLFFRNAKYDGGGLLGKTGFNLTYGLADDKGVNSPKDSNLQIVHNADGSYFFREAVSGATKVELLGTTQSLYSAVIPDKGGAYHMDFELDIKELPAVDGGIVLPDTIGGFENTIPYIHILVGGRKEAWAAEGTKLYIHNNKEKGIVLTVAFADSSLVEIELKPYGVELGTAFNLGVNQNGDNSLDILLNDKVIKTFSAKTVAKQGASGTPGFFLITTLRNYKFDDDDAIEFTLNNYSASVINSVDKDRLFNLAKNNVEKEEAVEMIGTGTVLLDGVADSAYTSAINVGSLTKVRGAFDDTAKTLNLLFNILSVSKMEFELGGKEITVDVFSDSYEYTTKKFAPVLKAKATGMDGLQAATNYTDVSTIAEVAIPVKDLELKSLGNDLYEVTIKATAVKSMQLKDALESVIANSEEFKLIFEGTDLDKDVVITEIVDNYDLKTGVNITGGLVEFEDARASGNQRAYAISQVVEFMKTHRLTNISHNVTVFDLPALKLSAIKPEVSSGGWLQMGNTGAPRILFTADRAGKEANTHESLTYTMYNTEEKGLVIAFTQMVEGSKDNKTVAIVELGKKLGDRFTFVVSWDIDQSAKVYVDGVEVGKVGNATSARAAIGSAAMMGSKASVYTINFVRNRDLKADENFKAKIENVTLSNSLESEAIGNAKSPVDLAYVQYSTSPADTFDTRFISVVRTLGLKKVGYELQIKGDSKVKTLETGTVYTSFINDGQKITADKNTYFAILSEKDIPVTSGKYTVIVRPYAVDLDGKTKYGTSFELVYENGKLVSYEVYNYVYLVSGDKDPFVGEELKAFSNTTTVTLDETYNSVIYDLGLVTDVNRVVITSAGENFNFFNKNQFGLYYSEDNETYTYVKDYSVITVGNKVYFYNFDVDARYIKVNSTVNASFYGEGRIVNNIDSIITAYYSDKPLLAEGDFLMNTTVEVKNEKSEIANNTVFEFTLEDLGIDAANLKEDMSDIRFTMDGTFLPHYYANCIFYVRVFKLEADEIAEIKVLYNNETASSVSYGDEVFEMQYGTKSGWNNTERGWFNSVATMPNGDLLRMVNVGGYLYYYRSENGGLNWSAWTKMECSENVGECGAFIVDFVENKVFYWSYYLEKSAKCIFQIFESTDNGHTWKYIGTPGGNELPAPDYALTYSDGIRLSTADGEGPEVDYVLTTGLCRNLETAAFCTTSIYSKDGGKTWTFSDSRINYWGKESNFHEGGLSEDAVYEQEDGTLIFYARCQIEGIVHFAKSYSTDKGVTWSEIGDEDFSNIFTPNTQPIIEKLADGTPVFLWGGNNTLGARSYKRFPLNMAVSYDDAETFVDIVDASFQTVVGHKEMHMLHTNPDLTFYNYGGIENAYFVSTNTQMYILNVDDFLFKTKGAFDSFEDGNVYSEGWIFLNGTTFLSRVGATEGKNALRISENTTTARSLHYMEEGKVSFDFFVSDFGSSTAIELQSALNDSRGVTVPIRLIVDGTGEICYYDSLESSAELIKTGIKLNEGNNTITIEFNGNDQTATVSANGEIADIAYIDGVCNAISYITVFTGSGTDVSIDRLIAVRTDK